LMVDLFSKTTVQLQLLLLLVLNLIILAYLRHFKC